MGFGCLALLYNWQPTLNRVVELAATDGSVIEVEYENWFAQLVVEGQGYHIFINIFHLI